MTKVVINKDGKGIDRLPQAAYLKLIEWGCPTIPYEQQYQATEPLSIIDWLISESEYKTTYLKRGDRYQHREVCPTWSDTNRSDPRLVRLIEEGFLPDEFAVVEIPDGVDFTVEARCGNDEYGDGPEFVAEAHRTWG